VAGRYNRGDLRKETVSSEAPHANPITEFRTAIERAEARGIDTTLVALATADANGRPSVRMVLLRGVDERGFVFHTNYRSRKARELDDNPFASLCFHWPTLEEQIRVEGSVARLPDAESDAYFAGRPRGSQLGAWTSAQSEILESRERFDQEYTATEARFEGQTVPRPPFWGGFLIDPSRIEFWYGRTDRLHDRILYVREGAKWVVRRLYP
jgi:pyridoxamine 5'-phosphate oxidase